MKLSEILRRDYNKEIMEALRALAIMAICEDSDLVQVNFNLDEVTIKAHIIFEVVDNE